MLSLLLSLMVSFELFAQTTISGTVTDNAKEPLIGANVVLKGTTSGTITDIDGRFTLVINEKLPFTIEVSYVGYENKDVQITKNESNLDIVLNDINSILDEVVVSASRVEENIMQSPVTIEKLDLQSIKSSGSADYYDQMTRLKGVTTVSGSMTFNSINTRGFGGIANTRFVQLVDGIDNSAPLLNFPMGNLIGIGENDIKDVELVPGAASALYGPNAFNGIMFMTSKSPFDYEGLTLSIKGGVTKASNDKFHPLYNADVRYAKTWGKFGFKVTASYLGATDWLADDYMSDIATGLKHNTDPHIDANGETVIGNRPDNFNGVNTYGDEQILSNVPLGQLQILQPATANAIIDNVASSPTFQMLFPDAQAARDYVANNFQYLPAVGIRRTGLTEEELLDSRKASSAKGTLALYYKPKENIDINYMFRIGSGNSVYQGSERYALRNFYSFSNKLEATGKNFMIRTYMTQTNAGDSYNMTALGSYSNELMYGTAAFGSEPGWAGIYLGNFVGALMAGSRALNKRLDKVLLNNPNILRIAEAEARIAADAKMPKPGTPEFQNAIETIRHTLFQHADPANQILGGAGFKDKSRMFHTEGTYDFTSLLKDKLGLLVGANHRLYSLYTYGTIFNEDPEGTGETKRINYNEYGAFVQLTKKLLKERLRVSASIRYDKNENFDGVWSPRVAVVGSLGKNRQHNVRASFQTGFRNPDSQAQFIYFPASTILLGGAKKNAERYGIYQGGAYTAESFNRFRASALAGSPDPSLLQEFNMDYIKPEKLTNVEIGYKTVVKNLYIDWNAYFNWYRDFITQSNVVAKEGTSQKGQHLNGVSDFIASGGAASPAVFRPYYNVKDKVISWGSAIGLNYRAGKGYIVSGNYSYMDYHSNDARRKDDLDFNSPNHTFNIGLSNNNVNNSNAGFNVNYRWQSEFYWVNSFGSGTVRAFGSLDASASYTVKKWNTVFRIGGSNLIGRSYRTNIGGPWIGKTVFAGITYDGSVLGGKKKK